MPQFTTKNTTTVGLKQLMSNVSIKSWEITYHITHLSNESATFVQNVVFIS